MKKLLICVFAAISLSAARGQLGKSEDACAAAYSKPISSGVIVGTDMKSATYRIKNYTITAGFKEGAAVYLIYKKNTGGAWDDNEIKSVLDGHRLDNEKWKWEKDIITGRHGPAVHSGNAKHVNAPQHWHIFAHDDYAAEYYPEKAALLIWDASKGVDTASIFSRHRL